MFYVYRWYIKNTNETFYIGKGTKNRYKSTCHRNKIFKYYIANYDCISEILEYFTDENDALLKEKMLIAYYKSLGESKANLDNGGTGGINFVWTQAMRDYQSCFNPMKRPEQKERMSKNNPMKNPEVVEKVKKQTQKSVILNGVYYPSVKKASLNTGHTEGTICKWCKRGYDVDGNPCRYAHEEQKNIPVIKKSHPRATTPKAVIVDDIYYETVQDGANAIGGWPENLIRAIKANRTYKGHTCKYANQQPSQENTK